MARRKTRSSTRSVSTNPGKSFTFKCKWCNRHRTVKVDELIGMFDRERSVQLIRRHVLDCRAKRLRREARISNHLPRLTGSWLAIDRFSIPRLHRTDSEEMPRLLAPSIP